MKAMSKAEIKEIAPAVFAKNRDKSSTSDQYTFTSTEKVLEVLEQKGWMPHKVSQMTGHKRSSLHQKHMVRLFNPKMLAKTSEQMPELLLYNSHNGASTLKFMAGIFRFICENGLVLPESMFGQMETRHQIVTEAEIIRSIKKHVGQAEFMLGKVEKMKTIELSRFDQLNIAQEAVKIKFGEELGKIVVDANDFLVPRREEDQGKNLWLVFNTVQEHLLRGGIKGYNKESERMISTKLINNIDENIRLNQELFNVALAFV